MSFYYKFYQWKKKNGNVRIVTLNRKIRKQNADKIIEKNKP